jgi:hypothetical protein
MKRVSHLGTSRATFAAWLSECICQLKTRDKALITLTRVSLINGGDPCLWDKHQSNHQFLSQPRIFGEAPTPTQPLCSKTLTSLCNNLHVVSVNKLLLLMSFIPFTHTIQFVQQYKHANSLDLVPAWSSLPCMRHTQHFPCMIWVWSRSKADLRCIANWHTISNLFVVGSYNVTVTSEFVWHTRRDLTMS